MLDFRFYLAVFVRRLPYFIVLVAIGVAAGVAMALILPPVYQAEARLVVESEQIPDELAASTVQTDAREQLQIIRQRILTRDNLLDMVNRLGVYRGANAPEDPLTPDEMVTDMRQRIGIVTRGGGNRAGATIVTVSFSAPTGQLAASVTNEVVALMLEENIEMRTTVAGQTLEFFAQQVQQLDQELTQVSGEILTFKEANQDALPDSLDFRRNQQAAAQERLLQRERAVTELRDRRGRLVRLYEQTGTIDDLVPRNQLSAEARRLAQLQDQYATSVAVLSLDNPRVAVLRSQIEALEQIVADQKAADSGLTLNEDGEPLSEYDVLLADIDGQIGFIEEQIAQIEGTLADLAESIAATPGNSLTLSILQRNLSNLQTQYNQAVANKARAETGDIIESLSKGERISVIEQANAPSSPTSPDRPKIAMTGAAGGLAMGFGFIVLLELLNTAIRRPGDLVNGLEITPLVTVPYMRTRAQIWRRRLTVLAAVIAVLVGIPAVLWYVDQNIRPLQPIFERIVDRLNLG